MIWKFTPHCPSSLPHASDVYACDSVAEIENASTSLRDRGLPPDKKNPELADILGIKEKRLERKASLHTRADVSDPIDPGIGPIPPSAVPKNQIESVRNHP
jgi:hypothetical protein